MYHFVHVEKILLCIKHFYRTFMHMCTSLYTSSKNNGVFASFSEFSMKMFYEEGFFRFEEILLLYVIPRTMRRIRASRDLFFQRVSVASS